MCEATARPNIFKYATKELSQDAIICWLLDWAYRDVKPEYEPLRECGEKFIEALFAKAGKKAPTHPEKVTIWQQDNGIDVLADIGEYVLLIEDKIDGQLDSEQLRKYYDRVVKGETESNVKCEENIIPIFLKTGNHSLYEQVIEVEHLIPPYKVFDREDFLKVVEHYSAAHPILDDFTDRLKCWERTTASFRDWEPAGEWRLTPCQGFFRELENHLTVFDGESGLTGFDNHPSIKRITEENNWRQNSAGNPWWGWNWVPNRSGGFAGFWWYGRTVKSCGREVDLYLQLEIKLDRPVARKLCFKVIMKEVDTDIIRDCHDRILEAGEDRVRKPNRMGYGYAVTIAELTNPWLVFNTDGGPDIPKIVNNLIEAQSILDGVQLVG